MERFSRIILLCVFGIGMAGCGTINNFEEIRSGNRDGIFYGRVYGGVRLDAATLTGPTFFPKALVVPLMILDLPLSFGLDTVTLPITLLMELFGISKDDEPPPPSAPE